jgi:hypothetical protein
MSFVGKHPKLLVALILAILIGPFVFGGQASAASAAYLQDELIDDSVFLDSNSMNANQIQAFLSSIGSSLATYTTVETVSYYPNYNHTVSAAELIFDAGEVYGLNPQAIMATLQKEESLITDPSPSSSQMNFAMGYGCADSTGCSKYAGFFNQVDNGTWQLRFNYERARGNNSYWNTSITYPCANPSHYYTPGLFPGNNVTFINDYGTAYDRFTIQNASTASLYCYTPHAYPGSSQEYYSGSYNFVVAFDNWFGSTLGSLVRSTGDPTLYYSDGVNKYLVGSMQMAAQYGYGLSDVRTVAQSDLDAVPLASSPDTPNLSYVVKSDSDSDADGGTIYLVNGGIRYPITSMTQYYNFGFTLSQLGYMPLNDLLRMPVGPNLSNFVTGSNGFVYEINSDVRNGIYNSSILNTLDPSNNVTNIGDLVVNTIPLGLAILPNPSVLFAPNGQIWLSTAAGWYYVSSLYLYDCLGLSSMPNIVIDPSQTTNGTPLSGLSCLTQTTGGQQYIMDRTRKIPVDPSWGLSGFTQLGDTLINSYPTYSPTTHPLFRTPLDGSLYTFNNGVKDQIYNMNTFFSQGYTANDIFTSVSNFLPTINTGPLVFADGTVIRDNSTGSLYVIAGSGKYNIPNMTIFNAYGFNANNIVTLNPPSFSQYTTTGTITSQIANTPGATVFDSGIALQIPTGLQSNFGINGSTPTYPAAVASSGSVRTATPYLEFAGSGQLYFMDSGNKRPVNNWTTFTTLGGNSNNITLLSASAASLFPTGANE